jgi:hypothetical protein
MQEFDRTNNIQIDVWAGRSITIGISGTHYVHRNNHQHDRKRRSEGEVESTNVNGRG